MPPKLACAVAIVFLSVLLFLPASAVAQAPPACLSGTEQVFSPTGAVQTYTVPPGVTAVFIDASGAAGGTSLGYAPGTGVRIGAEVPVTPGETLSVLVGGEGSPSSGGGGGGGGGSFVFTSGGVLLVAAGGGGGAGSTGNGYDAQVGTSGHDGGDSTFGGAGGTDGSGGGAATAFSANGGGGGGWLGDGGNGVGTGSGEGGHRVSSPGDAAGGAPGADGGGGGYGGGGGGSDVGGGGGGGYSGGGGGYGEGDDGAGGGGSYVTPSATLSLSAIHESAEPGSVTICGTQEGGAIPTLAPAGIALLVLLLAAAGWALIGRRW